MEQRPDRMDGSPRRPSVLNVREKGKRFERKIVKDLKAIGYTKAATSRAASRLLDSSKVDISNVPYYIQCKNGYEKGINYMTLLQSMKELTGKNFEEVYPMIVLHKRGTKYAETLAVMPYEDLLLLLAKIKNCK
jgi:hypothetical protein